VVAGTVHGAVIARHREFWAGRRAYLVKVSVPVPVPPEALASPPAYDGLDWERDFEAYVRGNVHNALAGVRRRLALGLSDDWLPSYYPYFGISIHSACFGGAVRFSHGTSYMEPVIARAADWPRLRAEFGTNPWMQRLGWGLRYAREHGEGLLLASFRGANGPLDMANGVLGNALFTEFHDDPESVRRLLDVCTEGVLAAFEWQRQHNTAVEGGRIVPMGGLWVPDPMAGHVSLDAACLAGPALYDEFEMPWLERLGDRCRGVVIHTHMLGLKLFGTMCRTRGVSLFAPADDPNQPALLDRLDEVLAAAGEVPLMLSVPRERFADVLPKLRGRRAVFTLTAADPDDARRQLEAVDRVCPLRR
jgi:hypothetical protein